MIYYVRHNLYQHHSQKRRGCNNSLVWVKFRIKHDPLLFAVNYDSAIFDAYHERAESLFR